ncbi:MAG: hypothetical protein HON94_11345 [Methylococcales bacterium]|jgi:uncharacterized phiE125 gp8 family phage protein|nr:hypothetical protein [Methylococcales bacterium]
MVYKLKTAATSEPVTLTEAKAHLQVTVSDDDTFIGSLITAARMHVQSYMHRQLMPSTWQLFLDVFPSDTIYIKECPVTAISSIKYVDENGSEQTLSSSLYSLDKESEPARLNPVYGESWKTTQTQNNAVTIEFTAGYADADSVPGAIKAAILLLVGFLYENRGDEGHRTIPKSIYHLVDPYKSFDFYE